MVSLIIVGVIAVVSVIVVALALMRIQAFSREGWVSSSQSMRNLIDLQAARITTLENRLLAKTWGEFSNLQNVPGELDKASWAERERMEFGYGASREEMLQSEGVSNGEDLEGVDIGPTIG